MDDNKRILTDCVCAALSGLIAGGRFRQFDAVSKTSPELTKAAMDIGREQVQRIIGESTGPQVGKKTNNDTETVRIDGTFINFPPNYTLRTTGTASKGDMILVRNPLRWQNVESPKTGLNLPVNVLASVLAPTERPTE